MHLNFLNIIVNIKSCFLNEVSSPLSRIFAIIKLNEFIFRFIESEDIYFSLLYSECHRLLYSECHSLLYSECHSLLYSESHSLLLWNIIAVCCILFLFNKPTLLQWNKNFKVILMNFLLRSLRCEFTLWSLWTLNCNGESRGSKLFQFHAFFGNCRCECTYFIQCKPLLCQ